MPISINNFQRNQKAETFKSKWSRTEQNIPYYKTNCGIIAGAVLAGCCVPSIISNIIKSKYSTAIILSGITQLAMYVGCGAIIDAIRNKKARKAADQIARNGILASMTNNDNLELSRSGKPYYHSNDGKKYGTLLGAGIGAIIGTGVTKAIRKNITKDIPLKQEESKELQKAFNNFSKSITGVGIFTGILVAGLGGLIMGAITDACANKSARKYS